MAGNIIITPDVFILSRTEDTNSNAYSGQQGLFKATWDHLKYLETLGITTEIARNHGLSVNGRGPGTGWWDEPTRFGNNGWSCFRWNSSSTRTWEWYMFIQNCDTQGPTSPGTPGYTIPGSGNSRGVLVAAAISISGSTTRNPWGGTTGSLGSDTKGNPVWISGSNNYKLFIFPEANGVSGVLSGARDGLSGDFSFGGNSSHRIVNLISDDDSFIYLRNNGTDEFSFGYMGLYEPFYKKDVNGVEDNTTPNFVCYWNSTATNFNPWESAADVGSLTVNPGANEQGACIMPHETDHQMRGIRTLLIPDSTQDGLHLQVTAGRRGNPTAPLHDATFSLRSPGVFGSIKSFQGPVGRFDPRMLKITKDIPQFSRITNIDPPRIVINPGENGSNLVTSFAIPWHPDAPILENRNRFGDRRRFIITSSG